MKISCKIESMKDLIFSRKFCINFISIFIGITFISKLNIQKFLTFKDAIWIAWRVSWVEICINIIAKRCARIIEILEESPCVFAEAKLEHILVATVTWWWDVGAHCRPDECWEWRDPWIIGWLIIEIINVFCQVIWLRLIE